MMTQVAAKLISPVTTMVLARLLAPEAFGVIATAQMFMSLADMLSDAGFQKYLIQHNFRDEASRDLAANVAFWTNLAVSLLLVLGIVVFSDQLAAAVGNPGLGSVLVVSSLSIPRTSLVSVQTALYQKEFDFKTIFTVRVSTSLLIFLVSVPMALLGFGYWSMIVATVVSNLFMAIWLTAKSRWKPGLAYSFAVLRQMFSYGMWILVESFGTWLNTWAGTFILGVLLDSYHVGLYKTTTSTCGSITGIFTAALMPVVFSALSKAQTDDEAFKRMFYKSGQYLALCIFPISFAICAYHHLFTFLFLGDQWYETELFIGLWMLSGGFSVSYGYLCSEAYRAKGKPWCCAVVQFLYLVPFLPALYLSALGGYGVITYVMPVVRLALPAINVSLCCFVFGFSFRKMLGGTKWFIGASVLAMLPAAVFTYFGWGIPAQIGCAVVTVFIYLGIILAVGETRALLFDLLGKLGIKVPGLKA